MINEKLEKQRVKVGRKPDLEDEALCSISSAMMRVAVGRAELMLPGRPRAWLNKYGAIGSLKLTTKEDKEMYKRYRKYQAQAHELTGVKFSKRPNSVYS